MGGTLEPGFSNLFQLRKLVVKHDLWLVKTKPPVQTHTQARGSD